MTTILITGTSRGIGKATAEEFLSNSWEVIGTSTSNTSPINHKNYQHIQLNLSHEENTFSTLQSLQNQSFDCIINNAGILLENWADPKIDFQQLASTLEVNLLGPMRVTESLLPMLHPKGKVINISSNWGSFSDPDFRAYQPHYKISKAALNMYTKLLASRKPELTVIAFDPGWVKTDMGGQEAIREPAKVAKDLFYLTNTHISSGVFYQGTEIREW